MLKIGSIQRTTLVYMLLLALTCFYCGHILYKVLANIIKRKILKVGDICSVYIGEQKLYGFVINISHEVDILVHNRTYRFERNQIYA
ncbi:MAG: hypothetical protein K9G76_02190 [Bacteroidales bacterium]|nr:hypothetical protein [Bacteroidales bacterium]MCF8404859.1 hypothetical protein [Bacteroidales bacterium]